MLLNDRGFNVRVSLSAHAWEDLQGIGDEIAKDNPTRATTYVDEILDACDSLNELPERCALKPQFGSLVRRLLFGEYGIYFRILDDTVQISRILHGRRRIWPAILP